MCVNCVFEESNVKKLTAVFLTLAALVSVGCNTIHGIGKDIERGGEAIQRSTK